MFKSILYFRLQHVHIGVEGGLSEWSGLRVSVRGPGEGRSEHVTIGIDLRQIFERNIFNIIFYLPGASQEHEGDQRKIQSRIEDS